jgi:hypothetical protein
MASLPLAEHELVALPRTVLGALRAALLRDLGPAAATHLQEAGYAGGEAVFASFERWLRAREEGGGGAAAVGELSVTRFEERASEYFRQAGWGSLAVGTIGDAVVTLDSTDWWEDDPAAGEVAEAFITIGVFASFFSRLANEPLAVLQVESRAAGAARTRFLLGNAEVMDYVYEQLGRGAEYEEAVAGVA